MGYGAPVTIDLTVKGTKEYRFPPCNRLWLPKRFCISGGVADNSEDVILGIQVGDLNAAMQPWAIQDGFVTSASGAMDRIFVTVISRDGSPSISLSTGTDVGIGYGNTDGLSPTVYSGSGDGDNLSSRSRSGGGGD